jgi:hypothetical protein
VDGQLAETEVDAVRGRVLPRFAGKWIADVASSRRVTSALALAGLSILLSLLCCSVDIHEQSTDGKKDVELNKKLYTC